MNRSLKVLINRFVLLFALLGVFFTDVNAQGNSIESGKYFGVGFSFSGYVPGGDYADRFGEHYSIMVSPQYKSKKAWILSANAQFIFGNNVKQPNLLQNLRTENNEILDEDGQTAAILLFQRGYSLSLRAEKLFPTNKERNQNSGFIAGAGVGFIQHKIRIEHQNNRVPQIEEEYEKGYDRLSNGMLLEQSIGYYHVSLTKLINFKIEFVLNQGFTQSRRDYNFDDMAKDNTKRLDIFTGIRATILLPLYRRQANDFYIN